MVPCGRQPGLVLALTCARERTPFGRIFGKVPLVMRRAGDACLTSAEELGNWRGVRCCYIWVLVRRPRVIAVELGGYSGKELY